MTDGVDLSAYQSPERCDWQQMYAHGVRFAIARASDGSAVDPAYFPHIRGARSAGILGAAYGFLYLGAPSPTGTPTRDAKAQVDAMAEACSTAPADFVALDCEVQIPSGMDHKAVADWYQGAAEYCTATLKKPIIYTFPYYLDCWNSAMGDYDLWISHVTLSAKPIVPRPWKDYTIWQWTGDAVVTGEVPGYPGHALRDRFNGDETALLGWVERG